MSKNEWKKLGGIAGRMLLAFAFIFSQGALARQNEKAKDKASAPQDASAQKKAAGAAPTKASPEVEESESAAAQEKKSDDPAHEGIKVHGHWTIEVKNPDGTAVTHREFENSLAAGNGSILLSNVLGRVSSVGSYEIQLIGAAQATTLFINEAGTPQAAIAGGDCAGFPSTTSCSTDLTINAANGTLTLAGSVVIPSSFGPNVILVVTFVNYCNPTVTPQACPSVPTGNNNYGFTSRSLNGLNGNPAPVAVSPGQTVAVTVNISFS